MSFSRKLRRRPGHQPHDWVAGMVQVTDKDEETDLVTIVWLEGSKLLAEKTIPSTEAHSALATTLADAVFKEGRRPLRVRVQGEGMASALRLIMPPSVNVVRAPTPELIAFLEKREGLPTGAFAQQVPTSSAHFLELPPFGRVAAEVFANLSRSGYAPQTMVRLSSAALGLEDALVVHRVPPGDLPYLVVYRDYQAMCDALRDVAQNEAWEANLARYRISYFRDASMTEEERNGLHSLGWWFDLREPDLRPVAAVGDGARMRPPSDEELEVLTAAAYATSVMLDERHGFSSTDPTSSLVLKLGNDRVANVRLSRGVRLALAGIELEKLVDTLRREPK